MMKPSPTATPGTLPVIMTDPMISAIGAADAEHAARYLELQHEESDAEEHEQ